MSQTTLHLWRVKYLLKAEGWRAFGLLADGAGGRFITRPQP